MNKIDTTKTLQHLFVLCYMMLIASCSSKHDSGNFGDSKQSLVNAIEKYVTCPSDSVDMMIASSDSICEILDTCSLEYLGLDDERINREMDSVYNNDIKTILKLYGSYDVVTNYAVSEADAAFAWHDIAKAMIAKHYGKTNATEEDVENLFKVINEILDPYCCGTQYDMNVSAWRLVMLSDFKLITAYKDLFDSCNDTSLLESIHASYRNVLDMFRNRSKQIDGHWSDLPRQLACMQIDMMDKRQEMIKNLNIQFKQGKVTVDNIRKELDKRPSDDKWDINDY